MQSEISSKETPPVVFWGYFFTPCIYESAYGLVSLHRTKATAWRAMNRAKWAAWEELRSPFNNYIKKTKGEKIWQTCSAMIEAVHLED